MATSDTEQFLRVEEEAHRLLDVLERLRAETQSYHAASALVDSAAQAVQRLVGSLADATQQIASLREALQSISTSELLRTQETVLDQVTNLHRALDQTQRTMTQALDQSIAGASERTAQQLDALRAALESAAREHQTALLRNQDILASSTSELQTEVSTHRALTEKLGQATTEVLKQVVAQTSALRGRIESTEQRQHAALERLQQSVDQRATLASVAAIHQQLAQLGETSHQEIETTKHALARQLAEVQAMVVTVRNLALFLLALLVITMGLFSLLAILMTRS
ncbi:MAG: hypothetical protein NZ765_00055 [Anaerolineae bacterium]|nr:hypothetical protein [Anaerolineae bacterium]MDW8069844.1 hypothetical protein [Anaerolineae bacterium]